MKSHSLLELTERIERLISSTYTGEYWVKAEISRLNFYPKSGHCYPELVEKKEGKIVAEIRSTIWKPVFETIKNKFQSETGEELKEGFNVLFLIQVKFSPTHGINLNIRDIDPSFSLGEMAREKKLTIEQLKNEGLWNKNRELSISVLPKRVAIVSVETSKGYHDFQETIKNQASRFDWHFSLFSAILQGDIAVNSISEQLNLIRQNHTKFDVVLIIRGGGGDVGLHCYNHYQLAKNVATFPIPVITGIGHSTNETVSEMVAHTNKITPTAVATFLINWLENLEKNWLNSYQILLKTNKSIIAPEKQKLTQLIHFLQTKSIQPLHSEKFHLQNLINQISHWSFRRISKERILLEFDFQAKLGLLSGGWVKKSISHLVHLEQKVELLRPENTLKRGLLNKIEVFKTNI